MTAYQLTIKIYICKGVKTINTQISRFIGIFTIKNGGVQSFMFLYPAAVGSISVNIIVTYYPVFTQNGMNLHRHSRYGIFLSGVAVLKNPSVRQNNALFHAKITFLRIHTLSLLHSFVRQVFCPAVNTLAVKFYPVFCNKSWRFVKNTVLLP